MTSIQNITRNWENWLNEEKQPNPQIDNLRRQIGSIKLRKERLRSEQSKLKDKIQEFNEQERSIRERIKQLQSVKEECGEGNLAHSSTGEFSSASDAESQSRFYSCNTPRTNKTGGSIPCGGICGRTARENGTDLSCKDCLKRERSKAKRV